MMIKSCHIAAAALLLFGGLTVALAEDDTTKKLNEEIKLAGQSWLKEKAAEAAVYTLPSGLLFSVITRGNGTKSSRGSDNCLVECVTTLWNGTKVLNNHNGIPQSITPMYMISAWADAVPLMREQDVWELYAPYDLAFGKRGQYPDVPPYAAVQFHMKLIKVDGRGKTSQLASEELKKLIGTPYEELEEASE